MRPTPCTSPIAGLAGVLGTLVTSTRPVAPSTATMSVNVPPVSMPMRRRCVMGERSNLAAAAGHCKPARARVASMKCLWLAVAVAALAPQLVVAQAYPTKPIRVLVPFPPGGSVDTVARLLSPRLGESLGQQLVVENRSGASGNIGMEQAARATPDGYTLLVNTNPLVTNGLLYSKLNYDTFADFAPISLISQSPSIMAINPKVPARNLQEFLELARAKPGGLNFATAGPATNPHVGGELVNFLAKTNIVAVHYKGGGPALLATIAGDTEMVVSGIAEVGPQATAGKLRAMGVTGLKRSPAYPDIPTLDERSEAR